MRNSARNPLTRKLTFAAAFVMVSTIATLAAFGPQAISLQRLLTPFVGASVAPQPSFKEVESQLHAEPPAPLALPGGTLAAARSGHTATLLADGKVLVVGGSGDTSAEVFDPATGISVATGNTNYARTGHTATRLSDGRVLVAGGGSASTELYDPAAGTFSNGPDMNASRTGHTATTLTNGNVIITGGGTDSVEVFNGTAFANAGTLTTARTNHSAVAMNDGRLFIAGGTGSDTAEIYNPADGTSVATGNPLAHARAKAHLRVLPDGKVQIIGGNEDVSLEVYDPAIDTIGAHVHLLPDTDTCTGLRSGVRDSQTRAALFFAGNADAAYDRTGHTITEVSGNEALVIGGTTGGNATNAVTSFASSPATITTDKLDYAPGETVTFNGTGFSAGETVRVVIHEDPHTHLERNFEAVADGSGNISGSYLVEEHDLNVKFIVNARGLTSNLTAQTAFTDARNLVLTFAGTGSGSVTITPSTGTVNAPISCGGTGSAAASQTVTSTCSPNITTSDNPATVTFSASAAGGSTFGGWTAPANLSSSNCTGTTNPCSAVLGGGPALTVTFNANTNTTTTVASSANPSVFGQSVTLTATVARSPLSGTPSPTGSVQFIVDGSNFGAPVALVSASSTAATAATSTSALSVGNHTVVADYIPGVGFNDSTNATLSGGQVVNKANTTTTLSSDHANPLAWSQIFPSGTGPSSTTCAQTSHADGAGRLIAYARTTCGGGVGEVWVLNKANGLGGSPSWSLVASGGPARHGQTTVYDQATNRLILFGGCSGGCLPVNNDVWILSNANGQGGAAVWTQMTGITGGPPAARNHAAGAYDPATNRLIIFGGQNGSGSVLGANSFTDVWVLTNANTAGGSHTWTQLATSGTFPLGKYQSRVFYDSANNRLTVAGGIRNDVAVTSSAVNVLTNANGTGGTPAWTNLIAEGAPGAPAFADWRVDYNVAANRGILAQQGTSNLYYLNNANGLGGTTSYSLISPSGGGGATSGYGLAFDAPTSRTMAWHLNGSTNTSFVLAPASSSIYGETVTFTATISPVSPGAGTPTGNVQFYDGATPIGSPQPLSGGAASIATAALDTGVHNITAQYVGDTNFNGSTSGPLPHTVAKRNTITTVSPASGTFGGAAVTLNATVAADPAGPAIPVGSTVTFNIKQGATVLSSLATSTTPGGTASVSYPLSGVNAGSYTIEAVFADTTNFNTSTGSNTLTIDRANPTVTATGGTFTYDGNSHTGSCTVTGIAAVNLGPLAPTHTPVDPPVNAGSYTVTCNYAQSQNYNAASNSAPLTINKAATTTVVTFENGPYVYRGTAFIATATTTGAGGLSTSTAVVYSGDCTNVTSANGCTATATYAESANHFGSTGAESITITPATASITVNGYSVQYDGNPHGLSGTATGIGGADLSGSLSFGAALTNVPGGSITWSFNAGANYSTASGSATVTITQAPSSTIVTCPLSVPYTSFAQTPCTVSITGIGGLSLSPDADYLNNENVGTATASYTYTGDLNHAGSSDQKYFDITAIALTINGAVANDKVYNGDNIATVNFGGATLATPILGDDVTINSTGYSATFDNENVGQDKPVTVLGVTLAGADATNYTVSQPSGLTADITAKQLTLVDAVANNKVYDGNTDATVDFTNADLDGVESGDSVTFDATAYDAEFVDKNVNTGIVVTVTGVTLTGDQAGNYELVSPTLLVADITARLVTVSIKPQTKVFDGNTSATLLATDFVVGNTVSGESFTVNQTVGAYNDANVANATTVSATLAEANFVPDNGATLLSNYDFPTTASGPGSITKAPTTTTVTFEAGPYVYRGTAFTATASVTGAGGLSEAVTPVNITGDCLNVTVANGCTASATYAESANHFSSNDSQIITILRADATVVVNAYDVVYDGLAHTSTYTVTGVNGETGATVGTVDVSGTTHTNAGTYNNDPWTFTGTGNYNNTSGTVNNQIDKADAVCNIIGYGPLPYDGNSHGASGTCTGVGGSSDVLAGLSLGSSFTDVPGGTANWSFTDATGNYNNDSGSVQIEITQADATVTVNGYGPLPYDAASHGATGSATGVGGVDLSLGLSLGAQFTDVPGGTANWTFEGGTNYLDESGSVQIQITQADANVTVNGYGPAPYDGTAHGATGTATGVGGVDLSVGLALGSQFTDVPGGTANWTFEGGTNYVDESGSVEIVITQADANCSISGYGPTPYDANAHGASGSCTGVGGPSDVLSGLTLGDSFTNVPGGTANWSFEGGINYADESGSVEIQITQADALVTVNGYGPAPYDGIAHGATGTATGLGGADLSAGLNLGASFTDVPGGTANWTFEGGTNYLDESGSVQISITAIDANCSSISGGTYPYDGNPHTLTGSCKDIGGNDLSGLVFGTGQTNVPGGSVTWTFTSPSVNYNSDSGSEVVTITAIDANCASIAGGSYPHDGNPHTLTGSCKDIGGNDLSGLVFGTGQTNVPGGSVSWTFTSPSLNYNSDSGSEVVTITSIDPNCASIAGGTFQFDGDPHGATGSCKDINGNDLATLDLGATFTSVSGGTANWTFTSTNANYNNKSGSVTITITPAPSTTTITCPTNVTYTGSALTPCTANVTGAGGLNQSLTVSYTNNTNAGTATANASYAGDANHDPSNASKNFSIDKAPTTTTVTFETGPYTYRGTAFTATANVTGAGGLNQAVTPVNYSGSCLNVTVVDGCTASATYPESANHLSSTDSRSITLVKKALTVTASSHTIAFGSPVPTIAPSYAGLVLLETGSVIDVPPTCSTTYVVGALIGTYPSTCTGGSDNNYSFSSYVPGTVTVTTIYCFNGFLAPVGGSVESGNGGSFADPVRSFKLNSTIPFKFTLFNVGCSGSPILTGVHTLRLIKYSNATDSEPAIDATPTDAATTGNQFRLSGTEWHFNLDTKRTPGITSGTWLVEATLQDGSKKTVWISIKR